MTLATHLAFNQSPAVDLAFELRLLENGCTNTRLFVYSWSLPTLVVGKGQAISEEIAQACESEGIPVLRRLSGGTAVLHNRTLNIGLVLPSEHRWARNVRRLYSIFISMVSSSLKAHDITVVPVAPNSRQDAARTAICFESHTDDSLLLGGKKVFGCAQRRLRDAILVHGTLLLAVNIPQQSRVFGVSEEKIDSAMTAVSESLDPHELTDDIVAVTAATMGLKPVLATHRGG